MNLWDYFMVLGLRQGASDDEIKKAYRRESPGISS
jgi:curved DNA-binding protein CbpA